MTTIFEPSVAFPNTLLGGRDFWNDIVVMCLEGAQKTAEWTICTHLTWPVIVGRDNQIMTSSRHAVERDW
jgi:hypothetical protein